MGYLHNGSSYVVVFMVAMMAWRFVARGRRPAGATRRRAGTSRPPYAAPLLGAPGRLPDEVGGHHGIPAGWLVDPTGRFDQRYWSGSEWTEHVAKAGVPGVDPPPGNRTDAT